MARRSVPSAAYLARQSLRGVAALVTEDHDEFACRAAEILRHGPFAVHVVLTGLMEMATGLREGADDSHFWALEAEDTRTGQVISADEAPRGIRDALRIAVAYGNGDHATVDAIIDAAARDPQDLAELMTAAFRIAAEVAKTMKAEEDGTDG